MTVDIGHIQVVITDKRMHLRWHEAIDWSASANTLPDVGT